MTDAISRDIQREVSNRALDKLRQAGYVSPQGVLFNCASCDFFTEERRGSSIVGFCTHPSIRVTMIGTVVEAKGCCNYWTYQGVTG
jgi:hypothetical protein